MKVKIGKFVTWVGPYQIAEALCFWVRKQPDEYGFKRKPKWVHDFGTWLAEDKNGNDSWLAKVCSWVHSKKKRKIKVHIDSYDVWNADHSLALIILPILKRLQKEKMGSGMVDPKDVPKYLRPKEMPSEKNDYEDSTIHERWTWALGEMIWAFEQLVDEDNDAQFASGECDHLLQALDKDENKIGEPYAWKHKYTDEEKAKIEYYQMVNGPNHTYKFDDKAYKRHNERIDNGLKLFGKYFRALWD